MIYDFNQDFSFSLGKRQEMDMDLLMQCIPNCIEVRKTNAEVDKRGIDYIARLDHGAFLNIDAKARRAGSKPFWTQGEPELALELWSVMPKDGKGGKAGWTCSRSSDVDLILYTFDKSEWDKFYLFPFQHLRMAFQHNYRTWSAKWKPRKQENKGWTSQAIFVPASVIIKAVADEMTHSVAV